MCCYAFLSPPQPMLKNIKIPQYTAVVPDFEKNQRAELVSVTCQP